MNKECKKCLVDKLESEFLLRSKKSGKLTSWCNDCRKEYRNTYYKDNVKKIKKQDNLTRVERLNRNRQHVWDYYKSHPCVDCGESDPIVLQFDHISDDKFKNVSNLVGGRYSLDTINEEISKCDVRCANCHIRKTSIDQNWYKDIIK